MNKLMSFFLCVFVLIQAFIFSGCSTQTLLLEKPPSVVAVPMSLYVNENIDLVIRDLRKNKRFSDTLRFKMRELIRETFPLAKVDFVDGLKPLDKNIRLFNEDSDDFEGREGSIRVEIDIRKYGIRLGLVNEGNSVTEIELKVLNYKNKSSFTKRITKVVQGASLVYGYKDSLLNSYKQVVGSMISHLSSFAKGNLGEINQSVGLRRGASKDLEKMVESYSPKNIDSKKWLVIISIENYLATEKVKFSNRSGEIFKRAAQKIFGISDRNTYYLDDNKATSGLITDTLDLIARNVEKGDTIYFYYSGHGIPDLKTGEPYLLPKDKRVEFVSKVKSLSLENIYKKLSKSKASKVIAFVDACFSGKTDNKLLFKGVAPGLIKAKNLKVKGSKLTVITAGKSSQFSNSYDAKEYRLFTYYLVRGLLKYNKKGLKKIYRYIKNGVKKVSWKKGDSYLQEPQLFGNKNVSFR